MSTRTTPFTRKDALSRFERMAVAHKKAIGQRIKELREAKGWTQPRLAAEIPANEVDAQQVSKWERGIHTPQKHLKALAETLGVDEGEILAGVRTEQDGTPDVLAALNGDGPSAPASREDVSRVEELVAQVLRNQTELLKAVQEFQRAQGAGRRSAKSSGPAARENRS